MIKLKYLNNITVFGVIISGNDVIPQFILLHRLGLNTEDYIKCPKEVVLFCRECGCWETLDLATELCTMLNE